MVVARPGGLVAVARADSDVVSALQVESLYSTALVAAGGTLLVTGCNRGGGVSTPARSQ